MLYATVYHVHVTVNNTVLINTLFLINVITNIVVTVVIVVVFVTYHFQSPSFRCLCLYPFHSFSNITLSHVFLLLCGISNLPPRCQSSHHCSLQSLVFLKFILSTSVYIHFSLPTIIKLSVFLNYHLISSILFLPLLVTVRVPAVYVTTCLVAKPKNAILCQFHPAAISCILQLNSFQMVSQQKLCM